MQSLLVTGACGFIGSNFATQQINKGNRVVVLDALTYAGHKENVAHLEKNPNFKLVVGNIGDGPLVSKLLREYQIDALVNFAAESHVDRSITGPKAFIDTNIIGTFTLLNAAHHYVQELSGEKKSNFRYLQVSTDEVYGSLGSSGKFQSD
jgi:dTDP-glucose 4,6-dehydratase